MVNKKRLRLWVKALRSRSYRQVRGALKGAARHNRIGYCCLGVGSKVYEKATGDKVDFGATSIFPRKVARWFGVATDPGLSTKKEKPDVYTMPRFLTATELNDTKKFGFKKIATAIEKKFKL